MLPGGRDWWWVELGFSLWWAGQSSVKLLSTCLLMGGAMFSPCWLFGLRGPSTGVYSLFCGANGSLWEGSHQ